MKSGLVHIYCGDGKGKTSAACGLALRCAYYGAPVVIAQFLKDGTSGECRMLEKLPNVTLLCGNPSGKFSFQMNEAEKAETAAVIRGTFARAAEAAQGARLLVLDEIMAAVSCGFLPEDEVARFLDGRPDGLEVVMTGRNPPEALLARADYVSEVVKRKHPFEQGIPAREGIEW